MKHLLLASTALVAFAGAAAAEVAVSGDARIGLRYQDNLCGEYDAAGVCLDPENSGWNVVNRARVKFTMTGETDSGLSFGAEFRVHEGNDARGVNNYGYGRLSTGTGVVWVSGTYGKLSAGDVDSALENAVGDLPEVGLTGLDFWNEMFYTQSGVNDDVDGYADDAALLYEYKFGDATIYASFQDQYLGYSGVDRGTAWSLGAGYTLGNYTFGVGYEKSEYTYLPGILISGSGFATDNDSSTWGISGGTSISGITFKAIYLTTTVEGDAGSTFVDDFDVKQYGIGAEYTMANGVGLAGFWRRIDGDNVTIGGVEYDNNADAYGIGASYDLGGGAKVKGGIVRVETDADDVTLADFGLALSF